MLWNYVYIPIWTILSQSYNVIIIIIYFENVFHAHLTCQWRLPHIKVPPHIPENCPFGLQIKQFHVLTCTFSPVWSLPAPTFFPHHLHISANYPILHTQNRIENNPLSAKSQYIWTESYILLLLLWIERSIVYKIIYFIYNSSSVFRNCVELLITI